VVSCQQTTGNTMATISSGLFVAALFSTRTISAINTSPPCWDDLKMPFHYSVSWQRRRDHAEEIRAQPVKRVKPPAQGN